MFPSECVCQLSRWSLILTTGKSESHNALGVAPNEEAATAAMRNQSQFKYWEKKKVLSLSLVFQWPLLCYPSKWMGSRAWVNSQLMIIKTHTCITDTVKPINTDHKGKWGQCVGSPSIPFCFWAEKSKHKRLEILTSQNVFFPTTKPTVSSLSGL